MTSRRTFLKQGTVSAAGLTLPLGSIATAAPGMETLPTGLIDLRRIPDRVAVHCTPGVRTLRQSGAGHWTDNDLTVTTTSEVDRLTITLAAPASTVLRVRLRWRGALAGTLRLLGDTWERGYGDLEWRGVIPDRVMPWYFATTSGAVTNAYGVRTGANAMCSWQADAEGITLWADVRSGGVGVNLGERILTVCDVVCRAGTRGASAFATLHAFCRQMSPAPRVMSQPVYGSNDWYWAYGKNSAESVRADAQRIVELSPSGDNRPFCVIDDGWQPGRGATEERAGYWDQGNDKFPDMASLATEVKQRGARPGIWIRPLQAPADAPDSWRLSRNRETLDPTVAGVTERVAEDMRRLRTWGYDLIKHDYSTWDIFGRWGFQMGASLTKEGWSFAGGTGRTTAEVINDLYRTIRTGAGDGVVIGCNTVSHLSAGQFDICRIGDDTSGNEWPRTRKMGVNTLAFRGVQHGAFYVADPDCVGVTNDQPWSLNRQWLDLLARSGTMLMVSLSSDALGPAQQRDLRAALALAAKPQPLAQPLDWQDTTYPTEWRMMGRQWTYNWVGPEGTELP